MTKQRRFTKEFEDEAVRLVATSGRTQREVAEDLGVGLSTLVRWIGRRRDWLTEMPDQAPQADMASELKRLRRENEILRQERDILKRATAFFAGGKSMRFALVDQAKKDFPVHRLCQVLGVSQSGYFAWKDRPASRRQRDDMVMLAHVRSAFALSNGTYGSPRMTRELQDDGFAIGRRRTARLMRENGLRGRQKRRFKRTTDSEHSWPIAPNIIDQDFTATTPNQKWGVDISYVWTREGWLYLAVVIDLFSRRVIGWAVGDRLHRDLALAALRKALVMRRPPEGLIHHSDRGSQYCSVDYQTELRRHGIRISMSGKGNCYDNAMVETFFKTIKSELVWRTVFYTRDQAAQAIARYIDGFYNPVRRHSALDYISPAQFERTASR
ncbi:MAG: IS3 family transposase [Candidatus Sphingomonas colombiensis]|nr:IS3 family transposase [Sphingomonas sp.]WEK43180.1 MAG: IS3 family transposase [Sphingomonas sp.]WEK43200.1 MAG: IS3 family transposase [Sphingomonas sp.]WEK43397.1 MAG: IS3 family transposase [Sphingomonas sp.]